jgi:hypothetical protein
MRWGFALAACAIVACGEDPEPTDADYTQSVMGEIFEGIRVALPASVDRAAFKAPENQGEIFAALDTLARNAALLEEHARGCDAQMGFLARSVERDAIEARTSYRHGRYKRSAFVLRQIVEDCVVCHTRLPRLWLPDRAGVRGRGRDGVASSGAALDAVDRDASIR